MNTNLLLTFIILNIFNVIIQTIKSLVTVKCGKVSASIINAIAYGYYTIVIVYTVCDLPLMLKVAVVGGCNLIGVFAVKWGEEIARKDKLWKIEVTVPTQFNEIIDKELSKIPHSYINLSDKHTLFNFYCATQKESTEVKKLVDKYNAKYFVAESKTLY